MLSIHWLYRKSHNSVVKMVGVDIIVWRHCHTTSTFYLADINVWERDLLMMPPMLNSNAGNQKVCMKKNLSWLFGVDRKIWTSGSLWHHSAKPCDAKQWPSDRFFYLHLTHMKDSYILAYQVRKSEIFTWGTNSYLAHPIFDTHG